MYQDINIYQHISSFLRVNNSYFSETKTGGFFHVLLHNLVLHKTFKNYQPLNKKKQQKWKQNSLKHVHVSCHLLWNVLLNIFALMASVSFRWLFYMNCRKMKGKIAWWIKINVVVLSAITPEVYHKKQMDNSTPTEQSMSVSQVTDPFHVFPSRGLV